MTPNKFTLKVSLDSALDCLASCTSQQKEAHVSVWLQIWFCPSTTLSKLPKPIQKTPIVEVLPFSSEIEERANH